MSGALRILVALVVGAVLGAALRAIDFSALPTLIAIADPVGGLWLNALRMAIVPLVFALVITGIAAASDRAAAGGMAGRSLALMTVLLLGSSLLAPTLFALMLKLWPIAADAGSALRSVSSADPDLAASQAAADSWWRGIVPVNPVQAAADGAMLPLVVFACALGFALSAIEPPARAQLVGFFRALADALLVIIHWVLAIAPIGVFALAFLLGARTGLDAATGLAHYVLLLVALMLFMLALCYVMAVAGGGTGLLRFARAAVPAQAVAISTQSSLASLPAMVEGCTRQLGIRPETTGLVMPLAVSVFRFSGPGVNLAVALYCAHLFGIELGALQLATAVGLAVLTSMAAVSLPGQLTFYTSIAPLCLVLGVPLDVLPILLAIENLPDIFRTIVNATADMSVTSVVEKRIA